jgi:hypothetical protein
MSPRSKERIASVLRERRARNELACFRSLYRLSLDNHANRFPVYGSGPLAIADWLEELAMYGNAGGIVDAEIAHQLSLAVENFYLVGLALNSKGKP